MQTRIRSRHLNLQNRTRARGGRFAGNPRRACVRKRRSCTELAASCTKDRVRLESFSQDPIGFEAGDANLYRYVGNQPTTKTDPTGLEEYEGPSIGPAPNPTPWWQVPFVRDPRSSNELKSPGMYHWVVGNIWFRFGFDHVAEACQDPWGPSAVEMVQGAGETIIYWDQIPDLDKQDMVVQGAAGVVVGGSIRPRGPRAPINVTDDVIREAMKDAPYKSQQIGGISRPLVEEYVRKLEAGEVPPPIKVDQSCGIIVDGNHRYVAGRIFGQHPPIQPYSGGRPPRVVPWEELPIDPKPWPKQQP